MSRLRKGVYHRESSSRPIISAHILDATPGQQYRDNDQHHFHKSIDPHGHSPSTLKISISITRRQVYSFRPVHGKNRAFRNIRKESSEEGESQLRTF